MVWERNRLNPNFILGLISYIIFHLGIVLNAYDMVVGKNFMFASFLFGFIHWLVSLIHVWTDNKLKKKETKRYFWLSVVIMIPPVAGMLYYLIEKSTTTLKAYN